MTDPNPEPDPLDEATLPPEPEPIPEPDLSDLPPLDEPLLDLGREAIRRALLEAISDATGQITELRTSFTSAQGVLTSNSGGLGKLRDTVTAQAQQITDMQAALTQAQADIAALQTAVAALQPPAPTE